MSQEESIKASLEAYGFSVGKIPERKDIKTPDFYVTLDDDSYTIELKTKYMNQSLIEEMKQAFDNGEMHTDIISLDFNQKYRKVIHKAKQQLETNPIYEDSFNIGWFHCEGHDASTTMELFENTLYGKAYVIDADDGTDKAYECYYYHKKAMFNKYKDILDGAVVSMDGSLKVLLNIYSSKYEALKNSNLCKIFKEGVQDPIQREARGEAIFVYQGMNRENIHLELQKKYSMKRLMVVPMKSYTITTSTQQKRTINRV